MNRQFDFNRFVEYSDKVYENYQYEINLLQNQPEKEKFLKFLPVYTTDNAYKKFIKAINLLRNKVGYP